MNLNCTACKQPLYTLLHPRHVEIIIIIVLNSRIVRDLPPPCWILLEGSPYHYAHNYSQSIWIR